MYLTPEVEAALVSALDEAVRATDARTVAVPAVRSFLLELSRESVLFRDQEWREQGINPADPDEVYPVVVDTFAKLLASVEDRDPETHAAPLMAVLEYLAVDGWCDSFPLCR